MPDDLTPAAKRPTDDEARSLRANGQKYCPVCSTVKALSEFYPKKSQYADGSQRHSHCCRPCSRATDRQRLSPARQAEAEATSEARAEQRRLFTEGLRRCGTCREVRPLTDFPRDSTGLGGRRYICSACAAAARKAKYYQDHEASKAKARETWPTRRDRAAVRWQEYYRLNGDRIRTQRKAHRQANIEEYRARNAARMRWWKAANKGASGFASRAAWEARWEYYGGRCWMCGEQATTTDHVIAVSRGGSNWPANLRPACIKCNASKYNRDWRTRNVTRPKLDPARLP